MITAKIEISVKDSDKSASYDLGKDLDGDVSLADFLLFVKKNLIVIADGALREEQAKGFPKDPVVFVDGSPRKPIAQVSPLGKIEFVAARELSEIALFTYEAIIDRSPVDTGQYKDSNLVFFNGTQIASNLQELQSWFKRGIEIKDNDTLRFVNVAPYARKLERMGVRAGTTKRREVLSRDKKKKAVGIRVAAPTGAYFLAYRSAQRKFKQNVPMYFGFIPGSYLGINRKFKARNLRERFKGTRTYLYPSIKLSISKVGIL